MALTKCKDCLLFDGKDLGKYGSGVCTADNSYRNPESRCPGAVPNVDQERRDYENLLAD